MESHEEMLKRNIHGDADAGKCVQNCGKCIHVVVACYDAIIGLTGHESSQEQLVVCMME